MGLSLHKLNNYLNEKQLNKNSKQAFIYGTSYHSVSQRSKFNPLRYLLGSVKIKALDPKDIFITKMFDNTHNK